jgi:hypothetical protein
MMSRCSILTKSCGRFAPLWPSPTLRQLRLCDKISRAVAMSQVSHPPPPQICGLGFAKSNQRLAQTGFLYNTGLC